MWAESQSIHDHCGPRSEQPCRSFLASSLIASSTSQSAKEPKFTFSSRPAVVWISYLSRYACCTPCIDLVPCVLLLLKALNRPHPAAYWNLSSSRQNGLGCIHSASIYQSTPIGGWQLHFQLPQTRVGSERERERELRRPRRFQVHSICIQNSSDPVNFPWHALRSCMAWINNDDSPFKVRPPLSKSRLNLLGLSRWPIGGTKPIY